MRKKKLRLSNLIPLGLVGAGAYFLYKYFKKPEEEPIPPIPPEPPTPPEKLNATIKITKLEPDPLYYDAKVYTTVEVKNTGTIKYPFVIGLSQIDPEGAIYDAAVQTITLSPGQKGSLRFFSGYLDGGYGWYYIITAVWDVVPKRKCEIEGTCRRIAEDVVEIEVRRR